MPREQVDIKKYDLHHKSTGFFNIGTSVASTSFPGSFTSPPNRSKWHWEQAYCCITKQPPIQGSSYEQRVSFVLGPKVLRTSLSQTFSSIEQRIFVSVSVSTVPRLFVTSITLQLFFWSPTLSISDTEEKTYSNLVKSASLRTRSSHTEQM